MCESGVLVHVLNPRSKPSNFGRRACNRVRVVVHHRNSKLRIRRRRRHPVAVDFGVFAVAQFVGVWHTNE